MAWGEGPTSKEREDQILVGREGDGERGDAEERSWRGGE